MGQLGRAWAAVAVVCGAMTVVVAAIPGVHFAYRSATVHTALETAAALIAVMAAFLVVGRLRRSTRLDELLLVSGLGWLALSSVLFVLVTIATGSAPQTKLYWVARVDSTLGALVLAAAAFSPHRPLRRPRRTSLLALLATVGAAVATAVIGAVVQLPAGVTVASVGGSWPRVHAPASVLTLHSIAAVSFLLASVGFLRRAVRRADPFFGWLSVALVFAVFARVNYLVLPSRFTDWVYTGDLFRLLFYLLLLAGTMWEIRYYWRSLTRAAILEERRRIARDLHDGLAQELAYIERNLHSLHAPQAQDIEPLERLRRAVERAQLESRKTFAALTTPFEEPLDLLLRRAATEVAGRFGAELELDLVPNARIEPERAESVVRIACEAVANAARHSGSERIALLLDRRDTQLRLKVRDFGQGFDPALTMGGFGLISMRERAQAIGGELRIDSQPGRGTTVELAV